MPRGRAAVLARPADPIQDTSLEKKKSFPTGHSDDAAVLIRIRLLPNFLPKLKGRATLLVSIAAPWTVLVMVSRVVLGAHFATDTFAGVLITFGIFTFISFLLSRRAVKATAHS